MSKHSPGPWRFYTKPQPNGCPIIGDSKSIMVAMLANSVNENNQKETAIANANLIAAAPDLLEALEELLDNGLNTANLEKARAAIAKAKSETKTKGRIATPEEDKRIKQALGFGD